VPYAQTEAYRFYDGPIEAVEGLINAWPIDENLIDYVDGDPDAGVINQVATYPRITSDLLASLNEKGGEKNITAGFHAIEFLLWGQDLNADGPGQRSYLDYVAGRGPHADRRREYLRVAVRLLERNLTQVMEEWAPGRQDNYRARFLAMPPDTALASILQGIGILSGSELAGERLTVAYETKEQEDEHSCFSDNTLRDVLYDIIGIRNVFLGRHAASGEPVQGPALRDLLMRVDPSLAERLTRQLDASVTGGEAVPAPFDRAILGKDTAPGRVAVKRLIVALRAQADSIAQVGTVLGLKLSF
jgi:putative iron-regulated protein